VWVGLSIILWSGPLPAQDASTPTADARQFIGEWTASVSGHDGPIDIRFDLVDDGGQLVGEVSGGAGKVMILIEEIMKYGETLNLHYGMKLGSQGFQVTLSLTPEGEGLDVTLTGGCGRRHHGWDRRPPLVGAGLIHIPRSPLYIDLIS